MRRQKHSLSHYVLSTFDMGELVPVGNFEVLPGDSVRMSTSCLIRVSPLLTPVMHPVQVRVHHWFVPYRLVWTGWEDFITGGSDGLGDGVGSPPTTPGAAQASTTILHHLGVPSAVNAGVNISVLHMRAYNKIFNEFYRDQDLETEVNLDNNTLQNVSWEKDYFTAARPWTQKGPAVSIPAATITATGTLQLRDGAAGNIGDVTQNNADGSRLNRTNPGSGTQVQRYAGGLGLSAIAVNDLRRAFALQRYQEARAQYGSRFTEYLRYLGIRSSDARLQRPEYLGGGRATISFSEVLRTSTDTQTPTAPVGDLQGHGISAMRSRRWIRFFEEHGVVMTLASVRPRSIYTDGLHRKFIRATKEDYWQKELELIGQQSVLNAEIYAASATPTGVFGYQDRYADYRRHPSYVNGDFRSTLNDWHLARIFGAAPTLNSAFIKCVPTKRVHADQTSDVLWTMFSHSIQARRMVGHKTIGRIV